MKIVRLAATSFRRFDQLSFEPHPHVSVLRGPNASGKTSVLEAVYFATRASSFRARRLDEMPTLGHGSACVTLSIRNQADTPTQSWAASVDKDQATLRRFDQVVSRTELIRALPSTIVDRQLHRVIEDGPVYRRRYLDWGMFYVEQTFFELWRRHERVLRQRNQALRQRLPESQVTIWNAEFVASAESLHLLRVKHVAALQAAARNWINQLLHTEQFEFELSPGWNEQVGLAAVLKAGLAGDQRMGFTHAGPGRAELKIRFEDRDAKAFVSRGQQKMLSVAMTLAQAQLVGEITGRDPILLLDDLEAELATPWQKRLIETLFSYRGQTLVTSLEWPQAIVPAGLSKSDYGVFHVEHGAVVPNNSN